MSDANYSIKAVARMTGLTPHVIRVWEKRYGAVKPHRTETNRRIYSESDVHRLGMLRHATSAGHSIGNIANLPEDRLAKLAMTSQVKGPPPGAVPREGSDYIADCLSAVRAMDTQAFETVLTRAIVSLGQHGLLEKLVGPLAVQLGELWRDGSITAAHEHFASAVIRDFLARNSRPFAYTSDMPSVIVCTPAGQLHELGAVMVTAAAHDIGWRAIYLGTSLPAAEIAGAAIQNRARAVALSIVYPSDDPHLPAELDSLRRYLPSEIRIIAGGRSIDAYTETLNRIGAVQVKALSDVYRVLDSFRTHPK